MDIIDIMEKPKKKRQDYKKGYWSEPMDGADIERKSVRRRNMRKVFNNEYY